MLHNSIEYSKAGAERKTELVEDSQSILDRKEAVSVTAQFPFFIDTFYYSFFFLVHGIVPEALGYTGLLASVLYFAGNCVVLLRRNSLAIWESAGAIVLAFELAIGGWLIYHSFS